MISVIVPIYGVEKYIRQCIESIIHQSYSNIEIILVDDGSPDNCPWICDEYAKEDSRIRVIHKKNGGLVSARQAGLEAAGGDYIAFVDGDDWIEPDMYEEMAKMAEKYSPDVICSEFYSVFDDRDEVSRQYFDEGFYDKEGFIKEIYPTMLYSGKYYCFGVSPNCWSKLFKKGLLEKFLPFVDKKTKMGEDAAFTYPCMLWAESMYCIKKPMYHYRILSSSMSRGYDKGLEDIIYLPYEAIKKANEASGFDISEQLAYYHLYLANFLIRNEGKTEKKDKNFAKRMIRNKELEKNADIIDMKSLPKHTRLLAYALRRKNEFILKLYMRFVGMYLNK